MRMIIALSVVLLSCSTLSAQVVINEINTGVPDYCEITNFGASPVNIGGWTMKMHDDPSVITNFTFPAGTMIGPGEVILIVESATSPVPPAGVQSFLSTNINWAGTSGGACALVDASDVGVDTVFFGNPTNLPTGTPLSPFTGSLPAGDVFQRMFGVDTDTPADWVSSGGGSGSPGLKNFEVSAAFTSNPTSFSFTGVGINFIDQSAGNPTGWAWDFQNDGIIDSTAQNPFFAYTAAGTYDVTLTVSNASTSDTLTISSYITIYDPMVATIPFTDDFSNGTFQDGWDFLSPGVGVIRIGAPPSSSPASGGDALLFDSIGTSGQSYTNEATLTVDLSGQAGASLVVRYWARSISDEPDAADGLFVSDGNQTLLAVSHQTLTNTWEEIEFDLSGFINSNSMNFSSTFELIFSQTDNFAIPTDGLAIDDVRVFPIVADTGQANQLLAQLDVGGGQNLNGRDANVGEPGPFFVTSDSLDVTVRGTPNFPYTLLGGPLNRTNADFGVNGKLDVGMGGGANNFADVFVILDGLNPTSIFDAFAVMNSGGEAFFSVGLEGLPPGILTTFQALVYQPGPPFVQLSAAFELTIP